MNLDPKKRIIIYTSLFALLLVIVLIFVFYNKQKGNSLTSTSLNQKQAQTNTTQQGGKIIKSKQILPNPVLSPSLSPDGTAIYYQNMDDGFFYKLNLASNKSEKISRELRGISEIVWSPDKTKIAFSIKQNNSLFEIYNSPFKNTQIEDGLITYWFYDFNKDILKKISDGLLNNIVWSPDGNYFLYHYTKNQENFTDTVNNISAYYPTNSSWDLIRDGVDNTFVFNFIDPKNIFLLWKPMSEGFECDVPTKINIDTKKEDNLISQDSCFQDFFVSLKSKWATYTSPTSSGFINIDTKETFDFDYVTRNILPEDSFSTDGKFFYGFKNNDDPNQIYKIDLNGKKIAKILKTDTLIESADQVMISPDEKVIYFLIKDGEQGYLHQTPII